MLTRIATHPRDPGIEQIVVSLMDEGEFGASLRSAGIELHCLGMARAAVPSARAVYRLAGLVRAKRPDVVMTWLYHADLMGTLCAIAAGLAPRRVVWNLRCSNIDFERHARMTWWIVYALARLSALPGAVAVNSQAGKTHHVALGFHPRRWVYLPNGVDVAQWRADLSDRSQVRMELGVRDDEIVVAMVARNEPQKDHPTFLQACSQLAGIHPNVRFLLVGKGTSELDLASPLQGRLTALGLRDDVARLMRGVDVHVLSSAFGEGFPNVVAEAMATEVPCVVTDVGDSASLVEGSGLAVEPRNPEQLAGAISVLLEEGAERRRARGKVAREKIARHYQIETVFRAYLQLWNDLAQTA